MNEMQAEKMVKVKKGSKPISEPIYYDYKKVVRIPMPIGESQHGVIPAPYDEVQRNLDIATKRTLKHFGYDK